MPQSTHAALPLTVLVLALLTGCSDSSRLPSAYRSPGATWLVSGSPEPAPEGSVIDDPPGANTCAKLVTAIEGATLMDPGVIDGVVRASDTADAPVADAAQRLASAYASALTAKGTADEPDAVAAVSAAAAEMSSVCDDSGLATVG